MISLITAGHVALNNQGQRIAKNAPTYQRHHHVSSTIIFSLSPPFKFWKLLSAKETVLQFILVCGKLGRWSTMIWPEGRGDYLEERLII